MKPTSAFHVRLEARAAIWAAATWKYRAPLCGSTFLNAAVRGVGDPPAEEGVAHQPVQIGALSGPATPQWSAPQNPVTKLVGAPGHIGPLVIWSASSRKRPEAGPARLVILAPGEVEGLLGRRGPARRPLRRIFRSSCVADFTVAPRTVTASICDPVEVGM